MARLALLPVHHVVLWPPADADVTVLRRWLTDMRAHNHLLHAIEVASPVLAERVDAVVSGRCTGERQVKRTVSSVMRYTARAAGRATPFGMFAGITPVDFGGTASAWLGDAHRVVARADAAWLFDVVAACESDWEVLSRLWVRRHDQSFVRDDRLVLPNPSRHDVAAKRCEVSVRLSLLIESTLVAAADAVACGVLADKLAAEHPGTARALITDVLRVLVSHGFLTTNLQPASTSPDRLDHVLRVLTESGAADVGVGATTAQQLHHIAAGLVEHNQSRDRQHERAIRAVTASAMKTLSASSATPLAVDTRADARIQLPAAVTGEAAQAGRILHRLAVGTPMTRAWSDYYFRFCDRFGTGSIVPVHEV
ncbi:MAG: lantibiotic dehydratase, partial [Stackebrandtia sp.]